MYQIVLFKNKIKKKIIKKFKTSKRAVNYYKSLLDISDNVIFSKQYDNGFESDYELALLSPRILTQVVYLLKMSLGDR